MRIAIIGTSNAILSGGYSQGVRDHQQVSGFDNFSLGASTTVVLPKVAAERDLTGYDFVLLDFVVNEEDWVRQGTSTIDNIRTALDGLIGRLGPDTVPVIVIMPTHRGLDGTLPVHDFYRTFASSRGYPLFDGFEYVRGLAGTREEQIGLFLDEQHLSRAVANTFGHRIVDGLIAWRETGAARSDAPALVRRQDYRVFRPEDVENGRFVERATSLTKASFVRLDHGGRITLHYDEPMEIIGVGLNLAETNGYVQITSGNEKSHAVVLPRYYKGDDASLTYVVMPVKPLVGRSFEIVVSWQNEPGATIEVAGVSIYGGEIEVTVPTFLPGGQRAA